MNNVFYTVMLLSIDESPTGIRPRTEEANKSSLAVIDIRQDLIGLFVNQRDAGAGIGHKTRDFHLVIIRHHVVIKNVDGWGKWCIWICMLSDRKKSMISTP